MRLNKKADTVVLETTIFIVLNILFIILMLTFVHNSAEGAFIYEQLYAKQIALAIDNAEPGMIIYLNLEKAKAIAEKNKLPTEKVVSLDTKDNRVIFRLSNKGGHSFQYFSDYNVSAEFSESIYLKIRVDEKNE